MPKIIYPIFIRSKSPSPIIQPQVLPTPIEKIEVKQSEIKKSKKQIIKQDLKQEKETPNICGKYKHDPGNNIKPFYSDDKELIEKLDNLFAKAKEANMLYAKAFFNIPRNPELGIIAATHKTLYCDLYQTSSKTLIPTKIYWTFLDDESVED